MSCQTFIFCDKNTKIQVIESKKDLFYVGELFKKNPPQNLVFEAETCYL